MADDTLLSEEEAAAARRRVQVGIALQALEGNPLDAEDLAMFEMFDRERWSHERCREYILARIPGRVIAAE